MPRLVLSLPLLMVGACVPSPPRVHRVLVNVAGVAVSNSPTRIERHEPTIKGGRVEVDYSLLFENRGEDVLQLETAQATATLADTPIEATCRRRGDAATASEIDISPGVRMRLDCRMTAPGGAALLSSQGDQDLTLVLPVHRRGDLPVDAGRLTFKYPLRLEDAK